ncbi:glycosyl-4,4'-diaponeurosporenoate acyltransferase CrtO family protein [Paenibacillus radicis (ex Gao et al. 2016)]|uniref:glycosyl-4,4'-diaponeurosporenoate acyltransferase CrtO family protein n=1 Tax=Paenibacillus radicis (ex Gao et al. 2016) TaxID=1737354 RepID=UPI00166C14A4|nr:glycosyl-4,4'-diaponeurosporenoate acyltransferase [Paenibacillus radicis (ex Gao et al. 2016)]
MRLWMLTPAWTLFVNIGAWLVIHLGVSYLCLKLPDCWFARTGKDSSSRREMESRELRAYNRIGIRLWKDWLPEGSVLLKEAFSKRSLSSRHPHYYDKFALEAYRGEWTHWLCMVPAPLFFLWNEPLYGWAMVGYAVAANLPFIMVQRYNRFRLERIIVHYRSRE